jgi:hypothetical protein
MVKKPGQPVVVVDDDDDDDDDLSSSPPPNNALAVAACRSTNGAPCRPNKTLHRRIANNRAYKAASAVVKSNWSAYDVASSLNRPSSSNNNK